MPAAVLVQDGNGDLHIAGAGHRLRHRLMQLGRQGLPVFAFEREPGMGNVRRITSRAASDRHAPLDWTTGEGAFRGLPGLAAHGSAFRP